MCPKSGLEEGSRSLFRASSEKLMTDKKSYKGETEKENMSFSGTIVFQRSYKSHFTKHPWSKQFLNRKLLSSFVLSVATVTRNTPLVLCDRPGAAFYYADWMEPASWANSGSRVCIIPRLLKDGQLNQIVFNFFCGMAASLFNVEHWSSWGRVPAKQAF